MNPLPDTTMLHSQQQQQQQHQQQHQHQQHQHQQNISQYPKQDVNSGIGNQMMNQMNNAPGQYMNQPMMQHNMPMKNQMNPPHDGLSSSGSMSSMQSIPSLSPGGNYHPMGMQQNLSHVNPMYPGGMNPGDVSSDSESD